MSTNDITVNNPIILNSMEPEVTPAKRTVAELRQELEIAEREEQAIKDRQFEAYKSLKDETIEELCTEAININRTLAAFKDKSFKTLGTLYELLQQYSSRHNDGKGNFQIEFGNFKIAYKKQGRPSFDERSVQAEKHIFDFARTRFKEDPATHDFIISLLERKTGELDINLVQKLYAMEDRFQEENWKIGIALLKESYQFVHSKDYVTFFSKDGKGQWNPVNLQFSNL